MHLLQRCDNNKNVIIPLCFGVGYLITYEYVHDRLLAWCRIDLVESPGICRIHLVTLPIAILTHMRSKFTKSANLVISPSRTMFHYVSCTDHFLQQVQREMSRSIVPYVKSQVHLPEERKSAAWNQHVLSDECVRWWQCIWVMLALLNQAEVWHYRKTCLCKVSRRKTQTAVVRYRPSKLPKSLQTLIVKAHTYSKINNYSTDAMCRLRKWSALATYRLWKTGQPSLGFRRRCQYDQFKECLMFISGSIPALTRHVKEVTVKTP